MSFRQPGLKLGRYRGDGYNVARGYTVDGQNKYTTSGGLNLSYDPRGNLNNDGVTSFGYDVSNKLTALSNGATLAYDAADRLAQTTGASTTRFLYDGQQIIGEYDASANVLRRYAPGPGIDQPLVWYEGSGTADRRFLLADRQGSVVAVTSASGGLMAINTYDEAGIPGPHNTGRFQWNGAPFLPEAGLYHMRARAYSPTLGRFMQSDPIGYGDGMNFYNYGHSDPVNGWDPSGLQATGAADPTVVGGVTVVGTHFCAPPNSVWDPYAKQCVTPPGTQISDAGPVSLPGTPGVQEVVVVCDIACQQRRNRKRMDQFDRDYGAFFLLPIAAPVAAPLLAEAFLTGLEIKISNDFRLAIFGNRTGNKFGKLPHYHRRVLGSDGNTVPGQGIGRHRPWEPKSPDKSFWDRF